MYRTSPLNDSFGIRVHDCTLSTITRDDGFDQLRDLFEEHSALLFCHQELSDENHLRLAELFGPIEDRKADERKPGEKVGVSPVSNQTADGGVTGETDMHTLHLKANQLWHIDSTFLPTPSLCNILTAKVVTTIGGETELASTRAAWAAMPEVLKARIRGKVLGHNYMRSRELISKELAQQALFNKWPQQRWPSIWANPVNGKEALFIASHVFQVEGMDKAEGDELIEELLNYCTRQEFTYLHKWKVGDILIWDQRAILHRGRPWPYDQPRTLFSVCCSMRESDGLAAARDAVG